MKSLARIKALRRPGPPGIYFGMGALVGVPALAELVTGIAWGEADDIIRGASGCVLSAYLLYYAWLGLQLDNDLLSSRSTRRVGYAAVGLFAVGFVYDVATTAQRIFY